MRLLFWTLIIVNAALFGYQYVSSDAPVSEKREPERIANQYHEDRIRLLSLDEVSKTLASAKVAEHSSAFSSAFNDGSNVVPNVVPQTPMEVSGAVESNAANATNATNATPGAVVEPPVAAEPSPAPNVGPAPTEFSSICVEIGQFNKAEATLFEMQLLSLALNPDNILVAPIVDAKTFMVNVPPSANQKAAEEKVTELQRSGVKNYFIIKDQSALRWAVSLGVFSTREAAEKFVADLGKIGVSNLQITPRGASEEHLVYRLYNLTPEQHRFIESSMRNFPRQNMHSCPPTS